MSDPEQRIRDAALACAQQCVTNSLKHEEASWEMNAAIIRGFLEEETASLREELCKLNRTLVPFRHLADGIPHNWPGECILRFDQRRDGSIYLAYHGINDASEGLTIDHWRGLASSPVKLKRARPAEKCYYCNSAEHEDVPCPKRAADAHRFHEWGQAAYPSIHHHAKNPPTHSP